MASASTIVLQAMLQHQHDNVVLGVLCEEDELLSVGMLGEESKR